jgi:hypothetical protein
VTYGPDRPAMIPSMIGAMAASLAYVAGAAVAVRGVAHAVPARQVLAGFTPITADNRRIMWGVAAVVISVTVVSGPDTGARAWVYRTAALLLIALAMLTALTGARTPVVWFKICPVLLAGSAVLLLAASIV